MLKIVFNLKKKTIDFDMVKTPTPIFAKKDEKLIGMIVQDEIGWALFKSPTDTFNGHWDELKGLMEDAINQHGCEFYIED